MDHTAQTETPPQFLQFPVRLNLEDMIHYHQVTSRARGSTVMAYYIVFLACMLFTSIAFSTMQGKSAEAMTNFCASMMVAVVLYFIVIRFFSKIHYRSLWPENSYVLAEKLLTFSPEGIFIEQSHSSMVIRWPMIQNILRDQTAFFIMLDPSYGVVIPYRFLPEGMTPDSFAEDLKAFRAGAV